MQLPKNTPPPTPVIEGGSPSRSREGPPPDTIPERDHLPGEFHCPCATNYLANASPAALLPPVVLRADARQRRTIFSMISPLTDAPTRAGGGPDAMYMDGRDASSIPAVVDGYDPLAPSGMCHGISRSERYLYHTQSLLPLVSEYGSTGVCHFISQYQLELIFIFSLPGERSGGEYVDASPSSPRYSP